LFAGVICRQADKKTRKKYINQKIANWLFLQATQVVESKQNSACVTAPQDSAKLQVSSA